MATAVFRSRYTDEGVILRELRAFFPQHRVLVMVRQSYTPLLPGFTLSGYMSTNVVSSSSNVTVSYALCRAVSQRYVT